MLSGTNTAPHSQEVSSCSILKKELHLFSCFGLSWVFAAAQALVAASRSSSPAVVCQLLMAVASLGLSVGSRVCGLAVPGLSSYGSWALEHGLSNCGAQAESLHGTWDLPRPGIEPASPALAGRFFTTEPPGKLPHTVLSPIYFPLGREEKKICLKRDGQFTKSYRIISQVRKNNC